MDARLVGYFDYVQRRGWSPRALLGDPYDGDVADLSRDVEAAAIKFARQGALNEGDAFFISQTVATLLRDDAYWHTFAPFWIADESRHADAFYRIWRLIDIAPRGQWFATVHDSVVRNLQHRRDFYSDVFRTPVHFWCGLALDEWCTAREYAEAANTLFRYVSPACQLALRQMAADESQHCQFALGVLSELLRSGTPAQTIDAAFDELESYARTVSKVDQFMFDQEPVGAYVPNFSEANHACKAALEV